MLARGMRSSSVLQAGRCYWMPAERCEESLRSELAVLGVRTLDVVLFTHPDEDHIGGGDMILREFSVKHIIFPPADSSEPSYLRLLAAAAESGAELHIGEAGARFTLGDADVTLLGPIAAYDEVNNGALLFASTMAKPPFCLWATRKRRLRLIFSSQSPNCSGLICSSWVTTGQNLDVGSFA